MLVCATQLQWIIQNKRKQDQVITLIIAHEDWNYNENYYEQQIQED